MTNNCNYHYSICAIVFGADETILNIKLKDGFRFEKKSIFLLKDKLDKIFETDMISLRRDYTTALLDGINSKDGIVICIVKDFDIELHNTELDEYWRNQTSSDYQSIDNQIRIIRLIEEGPVRVKRISFRMEYLDQETLNKTNYNWLTTVGESYSTIQKTKLHCDLQSINTINGFINSIHFPIDDNTMHSVHLFYDLSYHNELCVSLTLLTTSLELLFLNDDEHGSKKEMLSKRCATYIGNSPNEITSLYLKLKETYKKRSEFIHNGDYGCIGIDDVIFLRKCVRNCFLKAFSISDKKQERIEELMSFVKANKQLFGE